MAAAALAQIEILKADGNTAFQRGKHSAAANLYTEAIALAPHPVPTEMRSLLSVIFTNRGMCHLKSEGSGFSDAMEADGRKAAELDRLNPKAHYLIGLAHNKREEWVPAVRSLETGLEMARRQKRPPSLLREFEVAIALGRNNWHAASEAEDREQDAVLYSALQTAVDSWRDSQLHELAFVSGAGPSKPPAAGAAAAPSGADGYCGGGALPSIPERERRPGSAAERSAGGAAEDSDDSDGYTVDKAGSRTARASMPASGAGAPTPGGPRVRRPASAGIVDSASSVARAATNGLKHGAAAFFRRRSSVRYEACGQADAAAVTGACSSGASDAESGSGAASACADATAPATACAASAGTAAEAAGASSTKAAAISGEHSEYSARLSELFAEREQRRAHADAPGHFTCPITFDVMLDPVITPYGHSYDRAAIERYITRTKPEDPTTRKPLAVAQLVPNMGLKAAIQEFLSTHPWAHPLLPAAEGRH
jgi:hypothetical protein